MIDGGYDSGYKYSECFWGSTPGSLIIELEKHLKSFKGKKVLDLGCGEAKNSYYLANKGCTVDASDISEDAIKNAMKTFGKNKNVNLQISNALETTILSHQYDIIIAYGLFHCLNNYEEVKILIENCLNGLKTDGYMIVCAFNSREQDLSAHPNFNPLLLNHKEYLNFFINHEILFSSDKDLHEKHPHNNIPHKHSMTRLLIKK